MSDKRTATLPRGRAAAAAVARRLVKLIAFAWRVRCERRALRALDERMLKDIGLSRSLAETEAMREFLDLPEDRLVKLLRHRL